MGDLEKQKADLFDQLIEDVEQHLYIDNICRNCAGNAQAYVSKEDKEKCREAMSATITAWVKEIFGKGHDDAKKE